jgi:hypothetical protein
MIRFLYSLVALFLVLGGLTAQKSFELSKSFPIAENGTLHLESADADVRITVDDTDVVKVEISRVVSGALAKRQFGFDINTDNGDLFIKEVYERKPFLWNSEKLISYTIDIRLPYDVNLMMRGDDDNYQIEGIQGDIKLKANDGEVTFSSMHGNELDIELEDGYININDCNSILSVNLKDGNLVIQDSQINDLSIKAIDGDITSKNSTSINSSIKIADGDIHLDKAKGVLQVKSTDGGIKLNEVECSSTSIRTTDGDIQMGMFLLTDSKHTITTIDGDIDITILEGGGKFEIVREDSDIDFAEDKFNILKSGRRNLVLQSKASEAAYLSIKSSDGDITIK